MRNLPRPVKATLAVVLLLGLLAVVALAARGSHPGGHGRIAERRVPAAVSNDLLTVMVVLFCAGVLVMLILTIKLREKWRPHESHWIRDFLLTVVLFLLLGSIGRYLILHRLAHHHSGQAAAQQEPGAPPKKSLLDFRHVSSGGAHFDPALAVGLVGLLVIGGAIVYIRLRTRPEPPPLPDEGDVREELSYALSEAIDDLRAEPDERRAVIAAYARMEATLARHGYPRMRAEAPFEYVSRILLALSVRSSAVEELTHLFERAKFSAHDIDTTMKERAISALVSVRDDLREQAVAA